MKRIRGNGGARDILAQEDIAILSGAYRRDPIAALGLSACGKDEFVSCRYDSSQREILQSAGYFSKKP